MSNLLSIEQDFLNQVEVKSALNLVEFKKVSAQIENATKKQFFKSLEISKIMSQGREWFMSEAGKSKLRSAGITWTLEEFYLKAFGYKKGHAFRLVQASKIDESVVNEFISSNPDTLSIEALISFAKEGTLENGEESERASTIFTMSWKKEDGGVALRVDSMGKVTTKNGRAQIADAIAFLQAQLELIADQPVK